MSLIIKTEYSCDSCKRQFELNETIIPSFYIRTKDPVQKTDIWINYGDFCSVDCLVKKIWE